MFDKSGGCCNYKELITEREAKCNLPKRDEKTDCHLGR